MKKVISLLMSFVMLLSITAGVDLSVYADDVDHYLNFQADVYSSETAGFDNIFVGTDSSSFSRTFYNELKEDAKFQASLVLWSSTHIVDDPTYTIENNVFQKKDLYDAILFDMIDSTEKSTLYSQYGNEFTKLYAMVKNERSSYVIKTANKILGKEKYTVEQLKTTNLSEDAKDLLLNGTKYAGVTSVVSEVNDLLGKVKNAYDAINTVADYLAIKDVDYGTSEILNEIATDSQSPAELRISASQIKDCMSGAYGKTAALIVEGSISGIEFALNKAMNYAWDSVLACIPGGTAISFGAKTGRMLVNYFFKTETLIQGYYQLEAAVNIEDALIRAMQNKKNADTGYTNIDSAVYMKSVDMYKDIVLLGFDYSIELLQNAADSDFNTSTDFWLGNSSECLQLISQIEDFKQKKIDNFVCYEEIVFNKYKTIYFPNYDELEEEISKTVPVTSLNVTQLIDISVGDSDYFEDCFAYDYDPSNYTETTDVKVTSSNSNIISVVKADDSKEKFVANNAGTCTLTFTLNDRIACKRDVTVKPNSESGLITGECGESVKYSFDPSTGVLTIYGEGKMNNPHDHFASIPNIISVVIKYGVTSISSGAFYDCTSLTSVTIPNSVISIGDDAFINCSSLTNVTMPDSVISIGDYAFYECSSLTSVTIPDSVTSIDYRAFYNCSSLTNVTIGNSVTSIGGGAFKGCSSLTNVTMPDSVTSIGGDAFCQCSSLTSVTIPDSVTSIGDYTFENCTNLTSVTIPDSVTSIGKYAFSGCTNLGKVFYNGTIAQWKSINAEDNEYLIKSIIKCINGVIGNGNIEKIGDYEYQLNNDYTVSIVKCLNKSDTIIIPANTSYEGYKFDVTSIGANLFCDFSNLISVKIPDSVISIGINAFKNCVNLTSVSMSNSLISIGDSAFYGCTRLTNVTIPNSVTSIGGSAFRLCKSLTSVNIPNGVVSIEESVFCECIRLRKVYYNGTIAQWNSINFADGNLLLTEAVIKCTDGVIGNENIVTIDNVKYKIYNDNTATIVGYQNEPDVLVIPENIYYEGYKFRVINIGYFAFGRCTKLTSVTIPDSVTSIGDDAFSYCSSLTSVTIPDSVTSIGDYTFENCTNLTSVTIPDSVSSIGYRAFYNCSSLTNVTIGNSVTSIGGGAFKGCSSLTNVTIGNSVTSIGYFAFERCTKLTSVTIPDSVTSIGYSAFSYCSSLTSVTIPDSVTSIGDYAFSVCTSLTSVTIPVSVTSIGDYAFKGCSSLTSVTIPDSVTSIGKYAFYNCPNLTSVTIPNGVTSISCSAFYDCTSLTSVTIPDSVTSIGDYAFHYCENLTDVFYTGTQEEWNKIAIGDYNECLKSSTIHYNFVPCSENKHNAFGEWEIVKEATCTSDGLKKRVCAYDGYFETEKIEKINHKYKQTVIAPTCTTEGYTVYKCTNCDNEYKSDYVDKSEHNFTKNAQFCLNGCGTVNPNFVDTETTINPEGTTNPETTTQPEGTTNPETTTQPEGTTNPETTTQPESTTAPKTTTQPEGTTNPKQTTTSGGGSSGGGSIGGGGVAPAPETTTSENKKDEKQNSETTTNSNTSNGEGKTYTVKVYGTKAKKKAVVITWNTVKNVTGYQVQLATDKKFKKNKKTVTVKGKNKKKKTVKKLKAKKKYYVRIRSYKTVNGKKSYGKWSKAKSIKTK